MGEGTNKSFFPALTLVMGRVRTRTRKKDLDLGFFAGLGLGLAVGKVWWTPTRTRVQKSWTLPIKKFDRLIFDTWLFCSYITYLAKYWTRTGTQVQGNRTRTRTRHYKSFVDSDSD